MAFDKILTIIIPSYNMEKYLPKCLGSLIVAPELMERIEVIVVNDGSTDRTSEIAHEFAANYPQTFKVIDKSNGHYGSCINTALPIAVGTYIKILDADDKLVMEVSRTANHQLQIIRHYKDNSLLSRDIFDVNGVISATQFYDHRNANKVVRENFYRQDGTLVLIKSYTANEPYIQLFSEGNVLISTFDSDEELIVWWLKSQALRQSEATIFVSINSEYYKKLLTLRDSGFEVVPIVMKQSENADIISDLIEGKDKISAVMAGSDQVNTYLNKNAKNTLDITTLKEIDAPVYKE